MSEPAGTVPAERPLNNYRITLINGMIPCNVASAHDLQTFCRLAKGDGFIASDKMFIRFDAIATIEAIGQWSPEQNVVQGAFGPTPVGGFQPKT